MVKDPTKYRIGGYAKITPVTFDSLKRAIYEYGAVLAGFIGDNKGWNNAIINPPTTSNQWGHAVTLISFDKKYIKFQNSWGKDWGDKGYGYFDKNYLPFQAFVVLTDLPNNWKELLTGTLEKPKHEFKTDLHFGIKDPEVKILQNALKYFGCMDSSIQSVENFGPKTKKSVMLFQERYNIHPVAGYFGPLTRAKMNELLK